MNKQSKLSASMAAGGSAGSSHLNGRDIEQKGPCAESVETIRTLFESLRSSIARAEQRFEPALSPPPNLENDSTSPPARSALHGTLLDFEGQLRRAIVSVDLLADRSTL